jgi:hypothetical protein
MCPIVSYLRSPYVAMQPHLATLRITMVSYAPVGPHRNPFEDFTEGL